MPDGRKTAKLNIQPPGLTMTPPNVRIRVLTPAKAPLAKEWFVEGRDVWTDKQYGWGEAEGIDIQQMAETVAWYPGIPARMVWRFKSQVQISAGGWLHIVLPEGFQPECAAPYLERISLPKSGGCRIEDPQNVLVFINSTITPGEYAFGFAITPPTLSPLRNTLSLFLKDVNGNVKDAAVDIPGLPIREKLKIKEMPITWTNSRPLRTSVITVGFQAVEPLPDLVVAPVQQVSEILILLPVGFTHLVNEINEFTNMNEDMPLRDDDWLDYMQKDRLRVMMNLNRTSWMTLKPGSYEFRFPVLVPSPLPIYNVWHIALRAPNYPNGC